nr:heparin lyase I family protein [Erwinia sp. JUb26]
MSMQKRSLQYGGMNFRYKPGGLYKESCSIVQYYVRFPSDFDFVKGGKLPGLFGGEGNTGGKIPNGSDGFSVRILWTKDGKGQIYAYLPSSKKWGTGLAKNTWTFSRGQWTKVTMLVQLNSPNHTDGKIRLWIGGEKVAELANVVFRNNENLLINGLLFSTFFGGNNSSFAPRTDQYIDFKNVMISKNISPEMRCSDD